MLPMEKPAAIRYLLATEIVPGATDRLSSSATQPYCYGQKPVFTAHCRSADQTARFQAVRCQALEASW